MRGKPYTLAGRTQCLKHWALEFNIAYATVRERLNAGHDLHTALTAPILGNCELDHTSIIAVWRRWITAPLVTDISENNLT
jgi:hypothetical protein